MKFLQIATAALVLAMGAFTACQNDSSASQGSTDTGTETPMLPGNLPEGQGVMSQDGANPVVVNVPASDQAALAEPAQNAEGTWHYTCAKGCAGGAGSATACATCGATLIHNTKYHPKVDGAGAVPGAAGATPAPATAPPPSQKPEPAQNAAGVWHYTCAGGCAGGSGSAVPCAKCGKPLTHNATYHN